MVKGAATVDSRVGAMLISEFSKKSGLSIDTVRFYIRKGLLKPSTANLGGSRPYQKFDHKHLQTAERIRIGQALGLSLTEIGVLVEESRSGRLTRQRTVGVLREHRQTLELRERRLGKLLSFLDAKIAWLEGAGNEPLLEQFMMEPGQTSSGYGPPSRHRRREQER
jgi:MerR family transcriptional regulator, copper efflux regulator